MKKLMILASAVVMACGLQAATYDWGFEGTIKYDLGQGEKRYKDGTAFLFIGTVGATESAFTGLDTADFVTSGGYDSDAMIYGVMDQTKTSDLVSTDAKQAYTMIIIQEKNASVSALNSYEGDYILVTGESEIKNIPGSGSAYYAKFINSDDYGTSDWSTMSNVPEPTSGLLLLLGVAGLALRRRRA